MPKCVSGRASTHPRACWGPHHTPPGTKRVHYSQNVPTIFHVASQRPYARTSILNHDKYLDPQLQFDITQDYGAQQGKVCVPYYNHFEPYYPDEQTLQYITPSQIDTVASSNHRVYWLRVCCCEPASNLWQTFRLYSI